MLWYMVRVLVTISPRMYREAVALTVQQRRPDAEVRMLPPEAAAEYLAGFRPHLLVHNDTSPISAGALESVPWRVEVLYSDSMDVRFHRTGVEDASEACDASIEDLLQAVDGASGHALARGDA